MSERPSRCSSCKGRSGEKRWCVTVPERRGRGAARARTWPPVVHGQFRRKRSRQTPVGAALGRLRHLHVPGRRPHLPGRGPAAGHCQPAGHRPAWGPERQALPTMTPAQVVPFTSLRKSPLRGVCQKPGSGVIASEEGDILNGGEGKRPPQNHALSGVSCSSYKRRNGDSRRRTGSQSHVLSPGPQLPCLSASGWGLCNTPVGRPRPRPVSSDLGGTARQLYFLKLPERGRRQVRAPTPSRPGLPREGARCVRGATPRPRCHADGSSAEGCRLAARLPKPLTKWLCFLSPVSG